MTATETTVEQPTEELSEERQQTAAPVEKPVRPVRRPMSFPGRVISQALLILAIGVLGFAAFLYVVSPIEQNNTQDRLYATLRNQLAEGTAPGGGLIDPGTPVALLQIPGLNMDDVVVEGTSSGDLQSGPGHVRNTPLPGQAGVSLLYGKSTTFGGPFAQIDHLRAGDRVTAITVEGSFTYRVIDVRRQGDRLLPALTAGAGRLVLETATGSNFLQHNDIVYVDAELLGQPQSSPGGRPSLVPPEEGSMQADTNAYPPLALWLQALIIGLAAAVWARRRWGRVEALLVGAPILLAVVWNVYETAARLLPNLL